MVTFLERSDVRRRLTLERYERETSEKDFRFEGRQALRKVPKTETIHHQYDSEDLVLVSEEDGFWLDEEILSDQTDTHTAYAQFANCKGGGESVCRKSHFVIHYVNFPYFELRSSLRNFESQNEYGYKPCIKRRFQNAETLQSRNQTNSS